MLWKQYVDNFVCVCVFGYWSMQFLFIWFLHLDLTHLSLIYPLSGAAGDVPLFWEVMQAESEEQHLLLLLPV